MKNSKKKYFHINSLEKGFKVLELLAEKEELSVTKVAELLGFNRTGSHRFLSTLRELGYVQKNQDSRYRLTFKLLELGAKVANRFEIRRVARPFMQELASIYNETINLGFWDGERIVHLDKVESQEIFRIDPEIWSRVPAYCTGLGKSVLAFLPQNELDAFLASVKLKSYTPNTITTRKRLKEELQKTRERGFAVDNEELAMGLRCVAAPVFDYTGRPSYAISVAAPAMRITPELMERIQKDVKEIGTKLSAQLGMSERDVKKGKH